MMKQWLNRGLLLGMLGIIASPLPAFYLENSDVQNTNSDTSPSNRESHVNDYRFQDEQINVSPNDGIVRVLRTDQKNLVNDYVTATFPIRNANPREMRNVIRQVVFTEGGRAEVIIDKNTGDSFVQVICPSYMMPYIADAVAGLDVKWLKEYWDGAVDIYFKVQHREAAAVDFIASNYAGTEGFSRIDTTNNALSRFDEAYRAEKYTEAAKLVDIPCNQVELEVKVYEVTKSNDLKIGVDYVAWSNGPGRNLWTFATAGYSTEQRAQGLTSIYDPFIDARAPVYADRSLGKELVSDMEARERYRAVNYLLTSNYVDFLQSKGQARVITSQKLTLCSANTGTVNNTDQVVAFVNNLNDLNAVAPPIAQPFTIVRNNTIATPSYFIDEDGDGILDSDETTLGGEAAIGVGPEYVGIPDAERELNYTNAGQVGMSMELTPYVGLESMELAINMELSDLNGLAPNGTPIINARTVSSTVRLLDGQPFVLAGISQMNNIDNTAKAPFLGSIPVLGYLFGGETSVKRESNFVVVITPKFFLSNQVTLATPPRVKTLDLIMEGKMAQGGPDLDFGYDQWLLDGLRGS